MSQWTHVCIVIRFDALLLNHYDDHVVRTEIMNAFSNQLLPEGSEGPVNFALTRTGYAEFLEGHPSTATLDYGILYIWGDLRDFSDHQLVDAWISKALIMLYAQRIWVRQLVGEIEVEYHGSYVISTSDDYEHPENFKMTFIKYVKSEDMD